jgi:hypothetical protein
MVESQGIGSGICEIFFDWIKLFVALILPFLFNILDRKVEVGCCV